MLFLALVASAVGASAASAAPTGSLYVAQAGAGSLRKADGNWQLVLRRPSPRVTSFSDRPARSGGSLELSRFVSGWRAAFGDDAPNAALEIAGAPATRDVALLELGRPRLDRARDRIVIRARRLRKPDRTGTALGALSKRADRGLRGSFGRASLFVDDGGPANLLTLAVSNLTPSDPLAITLPDPVSFAFPPNATMISETIDMAWAVQVQQYPNAPSASTFYVQCVQSGCAGTGTVGVDAPTDQPLTVSVVSPDSGTATASWAGGNPVTLPTAPGGQATLPPAS